MTKLSVKGHGQLSREPEHGQNTDNLTRNGFFGAIQRAAGRGAQQNQVISQPLDFIEVMLDSSAWKTYYGILIAGWSSLVARWAHNPKVPGSNPGPATKEIIDTAKQ